MMKIIFISLFIVLSAEAQTTQVKPKAVPRKSVSTTAVVRRAKPIEPSVQRIHFGAVVWADNIELKTSDGRSEDVNLSLVGYSLGYSYDLWKISDYNVQLGAKAYFLSGKAKSKGASIDYQSESDKPIVPLAYLNVQYLLEKNISLGLGAEVMYYKVSLPRPSSQVTIYEFNYAPNMQTILHLELLWQMNSEWSLSQTLFASMSPRVGTGWNVSLGYLF